MNEKKKLSLKDVFILIFSVLIIIFQCIIMYGQFTHECKQEDNIKTELILHDHIKYSKNDLNPISRDLIIGDYTPTTITYYPSLSFSGLAGFGDNFSSNEYVLVGQLDESLNYGLYFYKSSGTCNLVLRDTDTQTSHFLGRYNYNASSGAWELVFGSDGYLGILQLIDASINFVPRSWMNGQTTTYTILEIGLITTTQQNYNYYFDTYTILGSSFGAYSEGVIQGENNVKNNPNNYGLYTQEQFNSYGSNRYQEGYNVGYDKGLEDGGSSSTGSYDTGFQDGKNSVINNPNANGLYTKDDLLDEYDKGYAEGSLDIENNGFNMMFNSILNAPYNILNGVLNFELFGVNLFNLFSFVFTIAIIGFVVKLLLTK